MGTIETGLAALVHQRANRRLAVEVYREGSVIGERALAGIPEVQGRRVEALLPTRIRWRDDPIAEDPTTLTLTLAVVAARARLRMSVACQKRRQSIPQQTAQWLLDLSDCSAMGARNNGLAHLTHEGLATLIGTPRSAVSHVIAHLARQGIVRRPDAETIMLDKAALESFAHCSLVADLIEDRDRLTRSEAALAAYLGLTAPQQHR